MWPGIGLPTGRDIRVANDRFNRETLTQRVEQAVQRRVLRCLEGNMIIALDFDAQRKIVAAFSGAPTGNSRMPSTPQAGDELRYRAVAADKKVCGYLPSRDTGKIGMRCRVEPVGKQVGNRTSAKFARWQADGV